jgi:hypothetical protein
MKLVSEYLVDAIKFDRMAEDATDVALTSLLVCPENIFEP